MSFITRASLPEEFFDVTSAKVLTQPEPQYLYAALAKMALGAAVSLDTGMPMGVPGREVSASGAPYSSVDQDRLVLNDGVFSEAITFVPEVGKAPGHTVRMNRPKFAGGGYDLASRTVTSGTTISTTAVDLSSEQVAITLKRFAGPYDNTNSRVAPYGLDAFDASVSLHAVTSIVGKHMKRDFDKWLDKVVAGLYDLATTRILYPSGFAADTDFNVAGDGPLDYETLTRVEENFKADGIQPFANGQYAVVLHPRQGRQLKNDPQYNKLANFDKTLNPLMNSFIGRLGKLDLFESASLNTNASTVTVYKAQAFGPAALGIGMGGKPGQIGPRVAFSTDDNYGEQAKIIWLAYMGFACLDERFIQSVRTS